MKVKFNVARDAEAKKAGETRKIELDIDFEGVPEDVIRQNAIANMVVKWQSQIRSHWDEFKSGKLPKSVKFGDPLFTSRRSGVGTLTPEEMVDRLSPEEKQRLLELLAGK